MKNKNKNKIKDINEYKRKKRNKDKRRKYKKLKPILITVVILVISISNLCGNAIVSNMKYEINSLKKDLRKEEIILDELKVKQLQNSSINNIEKEAKEKLNMNYPKNYQVRYMSMGN